ncbi:MAG TPA: DM13 domain-containing protein [Acidimicrobiales bacterium]|nr:DM13 domain-containing protein [Acidimicrobiales bacterium]
MRGRLSGCRRLVVGVVGLALVAGACTSGSDGTPKQAAGGGAVAEATAGGWRTWVLSSPSQIQVPAPPKAGSDVAEAELGELKDLAAKRTPEVEQQAHHWSDYPVLEPWVSENMQLVSEQSKNPPLASRGYGLVSVAMYDAIVATYHWKNVYKRAAPTGTDPVVPVGPDPSYPDEHAAIAGAASRVLAYLFPERPAASYDAQAEAAAESRVAAGMNYRSDVGAGLALGRAVADAVIAHARTDGSDHHFEGQIPTGTGVWAPPPGAGPANSQPVEPLAGTWRTWVTDMEVVRPGPPPEYGSPQFLGEAKEVLDTVSKLTEDQKRIAQFWAGGAGTPLPPGIWNQILLDTVREERLSTPQVARAFALLNVAQADAGNAAWDCKYAFWSPRPVNAIRDLGLDPNFRSFLPTPPFPSYISGHSTYSAAASEVLSYLFPSRAADFKAKAEEAAVCRLYGGIHYRSDNDVGLQVGSQVGQLVLARARQDGADAVSAGRATVATRPSATPTAGAGTNFDTPPPSVPGTRKSQPYWTPLVTLEGSGSSTTRSFEVEPGALQWRVTWHCETAPFTVVSVNASGQESRRKLADALSCPGDGEGFSAEKGPQSLRVTTGGPWKAVIEQQVDRPLIEPAPADLGSARLLGTAKMYNVDREGQGTARLYEMPDGSRLIRLEDFFVSINSDLELRLSEAANPRSTDEAVKARWKHVAPLKATVGTMNYAVSRDIDVSQFTSIVIWCEITRNAYAAAAIERA